MIEKKEDNVPSIKYQGIHESISTISLENVDQYMKHLEAQKSEAKSIIKGSFTELSALLVAREKQLLRQVDVMHDHLILCLQSSQSLVSRDLNCCDTDASSLGLTTRSSSTDFSCKTKAPRIEVSLDTEEMQSQIRTLGKVEVTGSNFMHLSEDNETFVFPYRVQSYQKTCEDHMLLYKSLDVSRNDNHSTSTAETSDMESLVIEVDKENKSCVPELNEKQDSNIDPLSNHNVSSVILEKSEERQRNMDVNNTLEEDSKCDGKKEAEWTKEDMRRFSEERPEDVRHWMREILHETNPEPATNDSDPERFDLFTVLKHSLSKEEFNQKKVDTNLEPNHSSYLATFNLLQQKTTDVPMDIVHQGQQDGLPVDAESSECLLVD